MLMRPFSWFRRRRLDDISDQIQAPLDEKMEALAASGLPRRS